MSEFQFVPDYIASVAVAGSAIAGAECVNIEKRGSYSIFVATVKRGETSCEIVMPYDFGLMHPESERPQLFAALVNEALPETAVVEVVAEATPDAETKPRKRRKASEDES